jgi:hypothetical protein
MNTEDSEINILELAEKADEYWFRDELAYAWRVAQDEAVAAYEAWFEFPGGARMPSTEPLRIGRIRLRTRWRGRLPSRRSALDLVPLAREGRGELRPPGPRSGGG